MNRGLEKTIFIQNVRRGLLDVALAISIDIKFRLKLFNNYFENSLVDSHSESNVSFVKIEN